MGKIINQIYVPKTTWCDDVKENHTLTAAKELA